MVLSRFKIQTLGHGLQSPVQSPVQSVCGYHSRLLRATMPSSHSIQPPWPPRLWCEYSMLIPGLVLFFVSFLKLSLPRAFIWSDPSFHTSLLWSNITSSDHPISPPILSTSLGLEKFFSQYKKNAWHIIDMR